MDPGFNEKLAEIIRGNSLLTEDELRDSIRDSHKNETRLDNSIINNRYLPESTLLPIVAEELDVPFLLLRNHPIDKKILARISPKYAHHFRILPLSEEDNVLKIAMNDPTDLNLLDEIRLAVGKNVIPILCSQKAIEDNLKKYYGIGATTVEEMLSDDSSSASKPLHSLVAASKIDAEDEEASIISFVNQILHEAIRDNATDVHIEPFVDELKVRYRVDGVLYKTSVPPALSKFQSSIISRIKIMANLDIAERRLPQDGRIKVKMDKSEIDLRVSILPTPYGESVNIRILAQTDSAIDLETLGLEPDNLEILEKLVAKPHGIIFVTGPTGSGKSTTLYACLERINNDERKILTIEDPIEYLIKGITQMQVNPKINFGFGQALRSMLRHDPDVMMVGEVRDTETAEITIRVALTGHLVFSTLHTNDAPSAITRLIDMAVEPFLIASSVECFIAQRLVRRICPDCKVQTQPTPEMKALFKQDGYQISKIYDGKGCQNCKYTGYKGRTAIFEFMLLNNELRDAILQKEPATKLREIALKNGMKTLRSNGWRKVQEGSTSVQEILKVVQETDL